MKKGLLIASVFVTTLSYAQTVDLQVIGSLGGSYADANIDVNYTAGEAVIETVASGSIVLTQGFHQPDYGLNALEEQVIDNNISLYPNPTRDELNIAFTNNAKNYGTIEVMVVDLQGKQVYSEEVTLIPGANDIIQLDCGSLKSGQYLLSIRSADGQISRAKFTRL